VIEGAGQSDRGAALQLPLRAPSSGIASEAELVARARAGDDRAFEALYARYRERIHAFILAKVRDHGRAEDLGQEVFMSALRQLRSSDDREIAFKPWLYTIARNACIDEFRRGVRAREVPLEADEPIAGSGSVGALRSGLPTPAAAIESKQTLADLTGALGGLAESQRRLLVMREFEGLSYEEIGARLGMSRHMVESGLFRARRKLGEEYEELASGRRCAQLQTAIDAGELRTVRGLGIRLRRRYARHLAHCQPCRHVAMAAGVDDALLRPRSILDKVAGLLPLPFARRLLSGRDIRRWALRGGRGGRGAGHHGAGGLAGGVGATGAGGASFGAGQAATLAALVLGGAGGGFVIADHATASRAAGVHRGASVRAAHGTGRAAGLSAEMRADHMAGHVGSGSSRHGAVRASGGPGGVGGGSGADGSSGRGSGSGGGSGGYGRGSGSGHGSGSGSGSGPGSGSGSGSGTATTSTTRHRTTTRTSSPVTGAGTTVQRTVTGVGTTVNRTVSGAGTTVNKTVSGVGKTADKTVSGVGTTVNRTVSGVGKTVNKVVSGVGGSGVGTTVQKVTSGVGTTVQKTTSGVGTTIQKTTSGVGTTVQKTTSGVGTTAQKTTSGVGTTVQKTLTGVTGGSSGSGTATGSGSSKSGSGVLGIQLP